MYKKPIDGKQVMDADYDVQVMARTSGPADLGAVDFNDAVLISYRRTHPHTSSSWCLVRSWLLCMCFQSRLPHLLLSRERKTGLCG